MQNPHIIYPTENQRRHATNSPLARSVHPLPAVHPPLHYKNQEQRRQIPIYGIREYINAPHLAKLPFIIGARHQILYQKIQRAHRRHRHQQTQSFLPDETSKTGRCGERLQRISPAGNSRKQRHLNIIYPHIKIAQRMWKINLHAPTRPGTDDMPHHNQQDSDATQSFNRQVFFRICHIANIRNFSVTGLTIFFFIPALTHF